MPGIEYILVFMIAFSSGYGIGKEKRCDHTHVIIKKKPWYALHIRKQDLCLHNNYKCKHKRHKHKRKWRYKESLKFKRIHYWGGRH